MKNSLYLFFIALASAAFIQACSSNETKNITAEQAGDMLLSDGGVTPIDARTPEEFAAGHLPGAVNMDVKDPGFETSLSILDKDKPYIVYCRSGVRSEKAAAIMKNAGFRKIYNMKGGITEWNGPLE